MGGVVNIVTARGGAGREASVEVEAGSFDTRRAALRLATRAGRADLAFSLSHIETDGISAADENDGNDEADAFEHTQLTFSAAWQLSDALRVGMSGFRTEGEAEFDGTFPVLADGSLDDVSEIGSTGARVFAELSTGGIDHTFAVNRYRIDRTLKSDGFTSDFAGDRTVFAYTGAARLGEATTLAFGFEHTDESYESTFDAGTQTTWGVFAELIGQIGPGAELALALRRDAHSDFDDVVSGRAALAFDLDDATRLRLAAATGFRAPSLYERFAAFGVGNPDLEPETSRSLEFGLERQWSRGRVEATLFFLEIDELIQYVDPGYVQVDGATRSRGVELVGEADLSDRLSLFGNLTYTEARDARDRRLDRTPRVDILMGLDAALTDRLEARATLRHVADTVDLGHPLDDYTVADLRLAYAFSDQAEAYLRVENLFDEEYQTARGYGTPDRAIFAGVRASF